jgi:hypothetical protein
MFVREILYHLRMVQHTEYRASQAILVTTQNTELAEEDQPYKINF